MIARRRRFTVALARVELGTPMQEVIRILLRRAKEAGVQHKHLLLDRGFYSASSAICRRLGFQKAKQVRGKSPPLSIESVHERVQFRRAAGRELLLEVKLDAAWIDEPKAGGSSNANQHVGEEMRHTFNENQLSELLDPFFSFCDSIRPRNTI